MIVGGQLWSLALSVIIIIACYMVFFRSFTAGILAAIPLFCAITLVFGLMGILDIKLDYITATITGISIGAGTDYTAYFLWRLRERSRVRGNIEEGYIDTMTSIGKGIVYNGFPLLSGFSFSCSAIFCQSDFSASWFRFQFLACIVSTLTILACCHLHGKPEFLTSKSGRDNYARDNPVGVPFAESKIPAYADAIPVEGKPKMNSYIEFGSKHFLVIVEATIGNRGNPVKYEITTPHEMRPVTIILYGSTPTYPSGAFGATRHTISTYVTT